MDAPAPRVSPWCPALRVPSREGPQPRGSPRQSLVPRPEVARQSLVPRPERGDSRSRTPI